MYLVKLSVKRFFCLFLFFMINIFWFLIMFIIFYMFLFGKIMYIGGFVLKSKVFFLMKIIYFCGLLFLNVY